MQKSAHCAKPFFSYREKNLKACSTITTPCWAGVKELSTSAGSFVRKIPVNTSVRKIHSPRPREVFYITEELSDYIGCKEIYSVPEANCYQRIAQSTVARLYKQDEQNQPH